MYRSGDLVLLESVFCDSKSWVATSHATRAPRNDGRGGYALLAMTDGGGYALLAIADLGINGATTKPLRYRPDICTVVYRLSPVPNHLFLPAPLTCDQKDPDV